MWIKFLNGTKNQVTPVHLTLLVQRSVSAVSGYGYGVLGQTHSGKFTKRLRRNCRPRVGPTVRKLVLFDLVGRCDRIVLPTSPSRYIGD